MEEETKEAKIGRGDAFQNDEGGKYLIKKTNKAEYDFYEFIKHSSC
jgi:hypothetical protein